MRDVVAVHCVPVLQTVVAVHTKKFQADVPPPPPCWCDGAHQKQQAFPLLLADWIKFGESIVSGALTTV